MVRAVTPGVGPAVSSPETVEAKTETRELERVAKEFEGVFIRQLLAASKFGEDAGRSGFGSMIVDALATSVTEGGGIGLAQRITEALENAENPRKTGQEVPK
jgi:Rod binding domain-containing protein